MSPLSPFSNQKIALSTKRLYYLYPDRMLFQAKVIAFFEEKLLLEQFPSLKKSLPALKTEKTKEIHAIVLDRTLFFPSGGGQKADQGVLETETITAEVLTTLELPFPTSEAKGRTLTEPHFPNQSSSTLVEQEKEENSFEEEFSDEEGILLHLVDRFIPPGSEVKGHLDQGNRRDYQQQHSAQHILSSVAFHSLHWNTLSIHLGEKESTIDFDKEEIPSFDLALLEKEANLLCKKNLKITSTCYEAGEWDLTQLRRKPKKDFAHLRVVEIENYDWSPCCGVHAPHTGLVSPIFILRKEKMKGKSRITFIAGDRAIQTFHAYHRTLQLLSQNFSTPIEALATIPTHLQDQKEKEKKIELFLIRELIENQVKSHPWLFDLKEYEALGEELLKNLSNQLAKKVSTMEKVALILYPFKENCHWILLDFETEAPTRFDQLKKALSNHPLRGGGKAPRYEGSLTQEAKAIFIDYCKTIYGC